MTDKKFTGSILPWPPPENSYGYGPGKFLKKLNKNKNLLHITHPSCF